MQGGAHRAAGKKPGGDFGLAPSSLFLQLRRGGSEDQFPGVPGPPLEDVAAGGGTDRAKGGKGESGLTWW